MEYIRRILRCSTILATIFYSAITSGHTLDYDIIYVRYPAKNPNGGFVSIPFGEHPYIIAAGADLILRKASGKEVVLVDCQSCSVMDPFVSYDGKVVYYSLIEDANIKSPSWLYKINLTDPTYSPIRLTYADEFDDRKYAANKGSNKRKKDFRGIRDMSPVPLADGRILFTSNRSSLVALNPETDAVVNGSVQQLFTMDDHNGQYKNHKLSNIKRLETGSIHLVQHPIQLNDGRILFSTWQDVATKFRYAMTPLFTVNPDGTNLQQFTEPHDHHKNVEHFITQLSDSSIVSSVYYPGANYGFGILNKYDILSAKIKYQKKPIQQKFSFSPYVNISYREFDRMGTKTITPHTSPEDIPAPQQSGRYSMPSATKNNDILVAYSQGSVNNTTNFCQRKNLCQHLKSGIYIIPYSQHKVIDTPNKLIKVIDSPYYNEIWPRAVLPYKSIYGIDKPNSQLNVSQDSRIIVGSQTAIVGTSSMYNRDLNKESYFDQFQTPSSREGHSGNWTVQGAEAGIFSNSDIYAVRIIGTPAKPFTKPIDKYNEKERWKKINKYLQDIRLDQVVARYGSYHGERWEILGEFPLNYKTVIDEQGNPDTSWAAKIPAETPFLIQALDKNGMTLTSELTWRALKPGEVRTDCGGCHAHSIEPLDFNTTFAGLRAPITNVPGTTLSSPGLKQGLWDLTAGKIPVLKGSGVEYISKNVLGVEFRRDVEPILKKRCGSCHNNEANAGSLILDGSDGKDVWDTISDRKRADGKTYIVPQRSKYIRVPQARQSLLVWAAYGERLDGRTNKTRDNDVDYPENHPKYFITEAEKRTIARWVDLGGPIDFPQTDGMGYTDDNQLPVLNMEISHLTYGKEIKLGAYDVHSSIDWNSIKLSVAVYSNDKSSGLLNSLFSSDETNNQFTIDPAEIDYKNGVLTYRLPNYKFKNAEAILIEAEVFDITGNKNEVSEYIQLNNIH
ncbi:hypothetical protein J7384_08905 [Endozoicomonas sp. G2_1]|uniref:HzsA-related protein n=1 Tax=Endozoicomonas sp. G2_1 TaxID=2821091 RepID=UPI001ADCC4E1|nr:hypothetical protein [Endozoicomonas sp. G2_1]MBO9490480.1 hypothetical protein [Endozoicomonas sp. G2_1]